VSPIKITEFGQILQQAVTSRRYY